MHLKTLKEAKSKAGSTNGGFLYSTMVRTVGREKPRSRMSLTVIDRWATHMVAVERYSGQFLDEN